MSKWSQEFMHCLCLTWTMNADSHTHTHTHPFNGPFSRTTRVSRYQKGKTHLDFTEERNSEWQWHQLGHMQVCTLLQTDNHASTPPLSFLQALFPGLPGWAGTRNVQLAATFFCKQNLFLFVQRRWQPYWFYLSGTGLPRRSWIRGR